MKTAEQYHKENPRIYEVFENLTFQTIAKGFSHYGVSGIFELIRWHTGVSANDKEFKINNNYKPYYARLFEKNHPRHKGFFRKRNSSVDHNFNQLEIKQ